MYPYLVSIYGASPTQSISGFAYESDGTTISAGSLVGVYGGGKLLNGGMVTTGANGFFYELVGPSSSVLFADSQLVIGANTKMANALSFTSTGNYVGMAYSDTQVLNSDNNLVISGAATGLGKVWQGLTQLRSTLDLSMTALNTNMSNTMGATHYAATTAKVPTNSSLELTVTQPSFNLNTPLSYVKAATAGASNAGLITVNSSSNAGVALTLSGGTYVSTYGQTYYGPITLGADATMTGTLVTTSSTVAGAGNDLAVNGKLTSGGAMTNLGTLDVSSTATLGGNVTSNGNQTYSSNVVLNGTGTLQLNAALSSGANVTVVGATTSAGGAQGLTVNAGTGVITVASVGGGTGLNDVSFSSDTMTVANVDATSSVTFNPTTSGTVGLITGNSTQLI